MKIHKIEIKNFKGFANDTFTFNPHFTVIIGENATGKTSILDALAVALGSFFIDIENVSTRTIEEKEIRRVTIDGQPKPQKPVSIETWGELDDANLSWKRDIEEFGVKITKKNATKLRDIVKEKINRSRQTSGENFPIIAYYSTGRLWAEHEKIEYQIQKEGIEMAYRNCLSVKSSSKEFLDWYKTQEDSIFKFQRPLEIAHLNAFKNTVISLLPQNTWKNMFFDRKLEQLVGTFVDKQGREHTLDYRQLSDGYRNMIGLAADIAYRCIQLNPHLGEQAITESKGVVLIDEIDQHLHPRWQRRIVSDLKRTFPNIQFIATTHSPFIVQSLDIDEVISLGIKNETAPNKLSIEEIVRYFMGVESVYSAESQAVQNQSTKYLELLDKVDKNNFQAIENQLLEIETHISDPAVRAFLQMQKLKKQTQM